MAEDDAPKTSADNAIDNDPTSNASPLTAEPRDGNGVANTPTAPIFTAEAVTIPSTEELFSKQEDDVSNLILKLPQTRVPEFSVKLFRRRQMDWGRYKKAIGSTTGSRSEAQLPTDKEIKALQTTALMGSFQFNRTVGYNYMRKSLALMYHQNSLMKTLNTNLVSLGRVLEAKLEAIKLNSATPESKKAGFLAKFKNEFRDQSVRAFVMNLRGKISDVGSPIVKKYVTNPIASTGANFFSGNETLNDVVHNLQMGLRNASETIAEKLEKSAADSDVADDVSSKFKTLSEKFKNASTRIGEYSPSDTTKERLDRASSWIRTHTPSRTIADAFNTFLDGNTQTGDTQQSPSSNVSENENFVPTTSEQTVSFYNDSRDYYAKSLSLLEKIAGGPVPAREFPRRTRQDNTRAKPKKSSQKKSRVRAKRTRTTPKRTAPKYTSQNTPRNSAPPNTVHATSVPNLFRRQPRPNLNRAPEHPTIHLPDRSVRAKLSQAVVPHVIPLGMHPNTSTTTNVHNTTTSHIEIIEPIKQATQSIHGDTIKPKPDDHVEDLSDISPKNSMFSSLRDDLKRYASTTSDLLKGFFKHDKEVSDSVSSVSKTFTNVKDALLMFIPKSFRKNSYDEEVLKDDKVEEQLHDKETDTQNTTAGNLTGLAGLLSKIFGKGTGSPKDGSGEGGKGWFDTLLDLGELGEDATMLTLLKRGMGRSKLGRAALSAGRILKKPITGLGAAAMSGGRFAKTAIRDHGLIGGGLRIGGSALLNGAKLTGRVLKSPLTALAHIDKNIMRPIDAKAMSALGGVGRGIGSLAKGLFTTKSGLIGLGGLAVNNLTDHVTNKNSIWNRLGHTTGNAMEWGATGATLGSFIGPEGTLIGAGIGVAASAFITNLDLLGKGLRATGHGLTDLYHGIVGQNPVVDPITGKLLKPGKHGLLSGLAGASAYTQNQLLGPMKPKYAIDPNMKPWVNPTATGNPYANQAEKDGFNPSATMFNVKSLHDAYNPKNKGADGLFHLGGAIPSASAATLNKSLLDGQNVTDQKEYKSAYQLIPVYIQKKIDGSKALQFVLWSTSLINGAKDAAKIFNDNYTEDETETTYIRKIYQTRGTRFGGKSGVDKQKAFQELGEESSYASAVSSGATSFSFSQANSILGNPVKPLADGSGDMSAYYTPHPKPTSAEVNKRAVEAINFFKSKGWTAEQAAGIVGNLIQESGLDPHVRPGDNGTAIGLAQWHPDRRTKIAAALGKSVESMNFEEQLNAVDWELKNDEKGAGNALKKAKTPAEAGQIISRQYERPGLTAAVKTQEASNRGAIATNILGIYSKADTTKSDNTSGGSSPTATASSSGGGDTSSSGGAPASSPSSSTPTAPTNGTMANAPVNAPVSGTSSGATDTASASPNTGAIKSSAVTPPTATASSSGSATPSPAPVSFTQKTAGPIKMRVPDNTPSEYDKLAKGDFSAVAESTNAVSSTKSSDRAYSKLADFITGEDHPLNTAAKALNDASVRFAEATKAHTDAVTTSSKSKGDTLVVNQQHTAQTFHVPSNDLDISKPGLKPVAT